MKYILIPFFRSLIALYVIATTPLCLFFVCLSCLWDFKFQRIKSSLKGPFIESSFWQTQTFGYYYYKSPIDYILNKKTYIERKIGHEE